MKFLAIRYVLQFSLKKNNRMAPDVIEIMAEAQNLFNVKFFKFSYSNVIMDLIYNNQEEYN